MPALVLSPRFCGTIKPIIARGISFAMFTMSCAARNFRHRAGDLAGRRAARAIERAGDRARKTNGNNPAK
jgi:hypothetical protein